MVGAPLRESVRLRRFLERGEKAALAISESPATANRATRRHFGLFGRVWKWDVNGTEMQRTFVPRYLRRHYAPGVARTRRARRHQAVIVRISRQKGIIQ